LNFNFEPIDGSMGWEHTVHNFGPTGGVFVALYNTDMSITKFAHDCFQYGLSNHLHVKLATKPQHLRHYDQRYCDIFREVFNDHYAEEFESSLLTYEFRSLDSATAAMM
jgi:isocitrate dehydrogenase